MPNVPIKSTYCEPTVMWRLSHHDGRRAHAMIFPSGIKASAVWFIHGRPVEAHAFLDWDAAIQWVDGIRCQLEKTGWRAADQHR